MMTRLFVSSALALALVACTSFGPGSDDPSGGPPDAPAETTTSAPLPAAAGGGGAGAAAASGAAPAGAASDGGSGSDAGCASGSCDKPTTTPAPKPLPTCCGGKATCVPSASVPSDVKSSVDEGSCTTSGDLCVPNLYLKDPTYQPPACHSSVPLIGGKGACVSKCLPDTDFLERDGCDPDSVCAPCSTMPKGTTACGK